MASLDVVEGFDHARLRRFGRLDFDGMVFDAVKNQEIDLIEARVAIEIEMRLLAIVNPTLEQFDDDEIFKELPLLYARLSASADGILQSHAANPVSVKKSLGRLMTVFPTFSKKGGNQ